MLGVARSRQRRDFGGEAVGALSVSAASFWRSSASSAASLHRSARARRRCALRRPSVRRSAALDLGHAFLPLGLQGDEAGVEPFGALALAGQFLALGGELAGELVARGGEARFGGGEFADAVLEIADLGVAGDQLQPQLGGLLAAGLELALGVVQPGGAGR